MPPHPTPPFLRPFLPYVVQGRATHSRRPRQLRLVGWLVAWIALSVQATPAMAYVLPADYLCRLMAEARRPSLKDATLVLEAILADREGSVDERIYLKRPERMRLWRQGAPAYVEVVAEGLAASGDEKGPKDDGTSPNPWPALVFPRGKDVDEAGTRMLEAIEAVGIDSNVVTLGRYPGGVAYVVGARPWENDRPQLWIDKTSVQPVRILWPVATDGKAGARAKAAGPTDRPGAGMHELRLLNYVGGLPRKLEEYEDGRLLRRSEVTRVTLNQNLPESLFTLPQGGNR